MKDSSARARSAPPGLVHSALAVGGFAIGTTEFATMSLLPFFARDLGIDEPTAGHVISAYALGVVVGAPLLAVVSARMARRLGPWLGGLAVAAGYGWTSTGWVGCGLALAGLVIWAVSARTDRVQRTANVCA